MGQDHIRRVVTRGPHEGCRSGNDGRRDFQRVYEPRGGAIGARADASCLPELRPDHHVLLIQWSRQHSLAGQMNTERRNPTGIRWRDI